MKKVYFDVALGNGEIPKLTATRMKGVMSRTASPALIRRRGLNKPEAACTGSSASQIGWGWSRMVRIQLPAPVAATAKTIPAKRKPALKSTPVKRIYPTTRSIRSLCAGLDSMDHTYTFSHPKTAQDHWKNFTRFDSPGEPGPRSQEELHRP